MKGRLRLRYDWGTPRLFDSFVLMAVVEFLKVQFGTFIGAMVVPEALVHKGVVVVGGTSTVVVATVAAAHGNILSKHCLTNFGSCPV